MPQSMRALVAGRVGEPVDVLRLESCPVPRPGAGQALIRVRATPIHASDLHVLRGRYGFSPSFPLSGGTWNAWAVSRPWGRIPRD